MKISEILGSGRQFPSLEVVPPLRTMSMDELLGNIRPLMEFEPPYINVTYHRDEYSFEQNPDGTFTRTLVRNRANQAEVCKAVMDEFGVEVVPHIICGGSSAKVISEHLEAYRELGVSNVLALRGDCLTGEKRFVPDPDGYRFASDLVAAIRQSDSTSDLCIGVGGYPEKHFEAPNLEVDIQNLKKKVDAGADYIITQMFFDNADFYAYEKKCREAGIMVPIIPGLKPLSSAKQVELLPEAFSINIPLELTQQISQHADDKEACYRIGQQWAEEQCRDLLAHGVPAVHFYTMGKARNVIEVIRKCF